MGGGASTPELAAAVSEAGGLGFLAAGYKAPDAVAKDIAAVRALTARPFGVNIFAPPADVDAEEVQRYAARLADEAEREGLELVASERVPVVSFAFGCPPRAVVDELHDAGCEVWVTVTTPAEAREAVR